MRVCVTGGAGYIGSVVVRELMADGHDVLVIDNLVTGHRAAVPAAVEFHELDTRDTDGLYRVFAMRRIEAVVHMAAISQVGTSVQEPREYFDNNVVGGLSLFDAMLRADVGRIVFSSTASVYGDPESCPIEETARTAPTSPYGDAKLFLETALGRYETAYGMRSAILRYFNAAGAADDAGEDHRPETHLIPRVLEAALGTGPEVVVFGQDYPTRDGTCLRDYIHVVDLSRAHVLALAATAERSLMYNLGCGDGYTVSEVVAAAELVTGRPIPRRYGERRAGDPAALVASSQRIRAELGWAPRFDSLDAMIGSAWEWKKRFPSGYV